MNKRLAKLKNIQEANKRILGEDEMNHEMMEYGDDESYLGDAEEFERESLKNDEMYDTPDVEKTPEEQGEYERSRERDRIMQHMQDLVRKWRDLDGSLPELLYVINHVNRRNYKKDDRFYRPNEVGFSQPTGGLE